MSSLYRKKNKAAKKAYKEQTNYGSPSCATLSCQINNQPGKDKVQVSVLIRGRKKTKQYIFPIFTVTKVVKLLLKSRAFAINCNTKHYRGIKPAQLSDFWGLRSLFKIIDNSERFCLCGLFLYFYKFTIVEIKTEKTNFLKIFTVNSLYVAIYNTLLVKL